MRFPSVDIVTVSYGSGEYVTRYLQSLTEIGYPLEKLRLIVVDNGSTDTTIPLLKQLLPMQEMVTVLFEGQQNLGFSGGCNRGAWAGNGEFMLFLNPDTRIETDMLANLVKRAESDEKVGIVEAAQFPFEIIKQFDARSGATDWCSGAAILVRRKAFEEIGGFDTLFHPAYCEDVDLSWRMWLTGWKCVYEPAAKVRHDTLPPNVAQKPLEKLLSTKFSFAMHFIYDSPAGLLRHIVKGFRYLVSPRTDAVRRRGVASGLWMLIAKMPQLISRRRKAQAALARSPERERFVFTEWYYGRWPENSD